MTEKLFELAPEFFKHKNELSKSLMGFGFCIGNGWTPLVEELIKYIHFKSKRWQEVVEIRKRLEDEEEDIVEGYPWIIEYFKNNPSDPFEYFEILQVKNKLGGLRFYFVGGTKEVRGAVDFAEQLSFRICEVCGAPGELRTDRSWLRTLCEQHSEVEEK